MHVDLKNNLVPWTKLVPLCTRICEKSIANFEKFSSKLIRSQTEDLNYYEQFQRKIIRNVVIINS